MRWFLFRQGHGYLAPNDTYNDTNVECLYFEGDEDSTEEEIKESFKGHTDIPFKYFDCVRFYDNGQFG